MKLIRATARFAEATLEYLVFASRWWQVPIYVGLTIGSLLYGVKFGSELIGFIRRAEELTEVESMMAILALIDIVMVMNLLVVVIIGGYSIFTSKLDFSKTKDRPQWLDNLDADRLKVTLATSLASISAVHLLKSYIDIHSEQRVNDLSTLKYEIAIHLLFVLSSLALAWIARSLDVDRSNRKLRKGIAKH